MKGGRPWPDQQPARDPFRRGGADAYVRHALGLADAAPSRR